MIDWYKKVVFENYANFNGRARRSEYWYFTLANLIIVIILSVLDKVLGLKIGNSNSGILNTIYSLAVFLPGLAVMTRRLHDVGKSGWLLLITYGIMIAAGIVGAVSAFSAIAGGGTPSFGLGLGLAVIVILAVAIWMLILFCTNGDEGANQYGPDPKLTGEEINEIGTE